MGKTKESISIINGLWECPIANGGDTFCKQSSDIIGAKIRALFMERQAPFGWRCLFVFGVDRE